MNVCQRPEELVDVEFDLKNGHDGFHLVKVPRGSVDGFWDEF